MRASDKADKHILQLNRLYAFLSQVNQMIVHAPDRETLFSEICKVAITHGQFRMAWIGLIDELYNTVTPVAWDGNEDGYLSTIHKLTGKDLPEGSGPTGIAIRNKSVSFINDLANDPASALWRDDAITRGYCSSCSLPLILNEKVTGVFNIYAPEPFFFDKDELRLLQEIADDISFALDKFEKEKQRNSATVALLESEKRYRELMENINLIAVLLDVNGKVTFSNPFLLALTGFTPEEMIGSDWFDLMIPEANTEIKKVFLNGLKSGEIAKHFENPIKIKNGELRAIFWNNTVLHDPSGTVIGTASIGEVITERKLFETKLQAEHDLLIDTLESMSDAFVSLDHNWCYTYMNKKAGKIFNRDPKEMVGKNIWTEFPEGVGQPFQLDYEKVMNERVFIQMEEYYPPYDSWFENRINPTEDGIAIFFQDITDRKKAEEKITAQLDELKRWQAVMVGRENRNIELKLEVNELLKEAGKPGKYKS